MAAGDVRGSVAHLERCLGHLKYPAPLDDVGLMLGDPRACLPILSFALLKYSRHVAAAIHAAGVQLQGKTDEAFVKGAFRLCRDSLGVRTVLTPAQFLEQGFALRKVLLLCDVAGAVRELHAAGARAERAKAAAAHRHSPGASPQQRERQRHSPSPARAAAAAAGLDTTPSQDQLIAAGLMPMPGGWRRQQQQQQLESTQQQADVGAGAGAAAAAAASPAALPDSVSLAAGAEDAPAQLGEAAGLSTRSSPGAAPPPQHPQLLWWQDKPQQCSPQAESPAVVLPQEQTWIPLRQQSPAWQQQSHQHEAPEQPPQQRSWAHLQPHGSSTSWQPARQLQQQRARACLWPKQQQEHGSASAAEREAAHGWSEQQQQQQQAVATEQEQEEQQLQLVEAVSSVGRDDGGRAVVVVPHEALQQLQEQQERWQWQLQEQQAAWQQQQEQQAAAMQQQLDAAHALVQQLQAALARADSELQVHRRSCGMAQEAGSARLTLLEGKLKRLEALQGHQQLSGPPAAMEGSDMIAAAAPGHRLQLHGASGPAAASAAAGGGEHQGSRSAAGTQQAWLLHPPVKSPPQQQHHFVQRQQQQQQPNGGAPAGGAGTPINWRASAAAAASAVVNGLSSSSPQRPLGPGDPQHSRSGGAGAQAGTPAKAGGVLQQWHWQSPGALQRRGRSVQSPTPPTAPPAAAAGSAVAQRGGTSALIDQLARRALEAQSLLDSLGGYGT